MACLIIDNLTRSFTVASGEKVQAIKEVDLQIEDQELMTLVGPSGSGKTTLLRLIAGLEEPDSGTIVLNGSVLNPVSPQDRDIAMVFQNYALYPHMSVYENLAFGLRIRKVSREKAHESHEVEHWSAGPTSFCWMSLCQGLMSDCERKCAAKSASFKESSG
jgi:multiple sugar transport system ATP-binding protein